MLSATQAFAVGDEFLGDSGVVLRTVDGGQSWDSTILNTSSLDTIFFLDDQRGWAAGNGFYHTVDGGATWIHDGNGGTVADLFFVDAMHGWACANGGYTYRTTDGGLTWTPSVIPDITTLSSIFFQDLLQGWVVNIAGHIYRSSDGGLSWSLAWSAGSYLAEILFFDDQNGWAIGGNTFLRTGDGGVTWQPVAVPPGTWVYDVSFADPLHGYGIGAGSVKTADGGLSWQPMTAASSYQDLAGIDFADPGTGLLVGATGIVGSTVDAGQTWSLLSSGGSGFTHGMDAVDALHAWAAHDGGEILRTVDGGAFWERVYVAGFGKFGEMNDVDFFDVDHGLAVGTENVFSGNTGKVVASNDGGVTWTVQYTRPGAYMEAVEVVDATTAYAVGWVPGPFGQGGFILRTTNGGQTWVEVKPSGAFFDDLHFVDASTGWAVGGDVMKTVDGGLTWVSQFDVGGSCCYVKSVSFADAQNGWFAGWGGIYRTSDGGDTWTHQPAPGAPVNQPLNEIHAVDAQTAWVVGQDGYVARTLDGGATWVQEDFVAGFQYAFESLHFLDADRGWVGGANVFPQGGIYLREGSGGFTCQVDLGMKGHGLLEIGMCGAPLASGGSSTLKATGAAITANKPLFLILSALNSPTYYDQIKWTLIPGPPQVIVPAMLDGASTFELTVAGGGGPFTVYLQAVAVSPLDYSGHATSNALQLDFLP